MIEYDENIAMSNKGGFFMKKLVALLLLAVMALSMIGCGQEKDNSGAAGKDSLNGVLSLGYSIVNITPTYSVPLAGYGNTSERMSTGFYSYLYLTCAVFTDANGNTIMVFQGDLAAPATGVINPVKDELAKKYGIPVENIMFAATHTHSAPDMGSSEPNIKKYNAEMGKWMLQAAEEAWADRTKVTKLTNGREQIPANTLNFTRHYTTEAGIVKGDNFGDLVDSPITGHVRDADSELQVIRFEREGVYKDGEKKGKKAGDPKEAITMVNWQTHPHRGGGSKNYNMTADLVGAMRDKFQKQTGDLFMYFSGASGNVNPSSRIEKENITADFKEQGEKLADYAITCFNTKMVEADLGAVQVVSYEFEGKINHAEDHLVDKAKLVQNEWTTNNNFIEAVKLANKYGINSPYHAGAIINKANMPQKETVTISAFCIGKSLGFVAAPYEMYSEQGEFIKEHSPFEHTFVITLCNGAVGYLASHEGFKNNSYGANTGRFAEGTAEAFADTYVQLLTDMYNK